MRNDASKYINTLIGGGLFKLINGKLASSMGIANLPFNMTFDYTAMKNPESNDEGLSLLMKGEVRYMDMEPPFTPSPVIPANISSDNGGVQVYITNYVLNSAMYSFFKSGKMVANVPGIPVKSLLIVFPALKQNFENDTVSINVKAIGTEKGKTDPSLTIVDGDIYLNASVVIQINVEHDGPLNTLIEVEADLKSTLEVQIRKRCILDPDIVTL